MAQIGPMAASISFQGNIACGGSASLVLSDDGTCTFNGSFHDSGFIPYGVAFALVVNTASGKAYSFTKSGEVYGTTSIVADPTKSRDFTWNDVAVNAAIKTGWADLLAGSNFHWKADVNGDVVQVLKDVVGLVQKAVPILQPVIAII